MKITLFASEKTKITKRFFESKIGVFLLLYTEQFKI